MEINNITAQVSAVNTSSKSAPLEKIPEADTPKISGIGGEKNSRSTSSRLFDRFENSGETPSNTSGIYRMGEDEEGNPKILIDEPEQAKNRGEEPAKPEEPKKTKCTANTDRVDAEIRQLREKRQEVQRQMQSEENAEKRKSLERQLASLDSELMLKDNDTYRKQNAIYTNG